MQHIETIHHRTCHDDPGLTLEFGVYKAGVNPCSQRKYCFRH